MGYLYFFTRYFENIYYSALDRQPDSDDCCDACVCLPVSPLTHFRKRKSKVAVNAAALTEKTLKWLDAKQTCSNRIGTLYSHIS